MALEIRDLRFWMRRAKIEEIRRRIEAATSARLAMAEDKGFREYMYQLEWEMRFELAEDNNVN